MANEDQDRQALLNEMMLLEKELEVRSLQVQMEHVKSENEGLRQVADAFNELQTVYLDEKRQNVDLNADQDDRIDELRKVKREANVAQLDVEQLMDGLIEAEALISDLHQRNLDLNDINDQLAQKVHLLTDETEKISFEFSSAIDNIITDNKRLSLENSQTKAKIKSLEKGQHDATYEAHFSSLPRTVLAQEASTLQLVTFLALFDKPSGVLMDKFQLPSALEGNRAVTPAANDYSFAPIGPRFIGPDLAQSALALILKQTVFLGTNGALIRSLIFGTLSGQCEQLASRPEESPLRVSDLSAAKFTFSLVAVLSEIMFEMYAIQAAIFSLETNAEQLASILTFLHQISPTIEQSIRIIYQLIDRQKDQQPLGGASHDLPALEALRDALVKNPIRRDVVYIIWASVQATSPFVDLFVLEMLAVTAAGGAMLAASQDTPEFSLEDELYELIPVLYGGSSSGSSTDSLAAFISAVTIAAADPRIRSLMGIPAQGIPWPAVSLLLTSEDEGGLLKGRIIIKWREALTAAIGTGLEQERNQTAGSQTLLEVIKATRKYLPERMETDDLDALSLPGPLCAYLTSQPPDGIEMGGGSPTVEKRQTIQRFNTAMQRSQTMAGKQARSYADEIKSLNMKIFDLEEQLTKAPVHDTKTVEAIPEATKNALNEYKTALDESRRKASMYEKELEVVSADMMSKDDRLKKLESERQGMMEKLRRTEITSDTATLWQYNCDLKWQVESLNKRLKDYQVTHAHLLLGHTPAQPVDVPHTRSRPLVWSHVERDTLIQRLQRVKALNNPVKPVIQ